LKKKLKEQSKINATSVNNQKKTSHVIVSTTNMNILSPEKSSRLDVNIFKP
jgi:hypothetical protein